MGYHPDLSPQTIRRVERMLARGEKQTTIAGIVGISKQSVSRISLGQHRRRKHRESSPKVIPRVLVEWVPRPLPVIDQSGRSYGEFFPRRMA